MLASVNKLLINSRQIIENDYYLLANYLSTPNKRETKDTSDFGSHIQESLVELKIWKIKKTYC